MSAIPGSRLIQCSGQHRGSLHLFTFPWVALRILYWLSNLGLWLSALILLIITFDFARSRFYVNGKFRKSLLILPALWISLIFLLSAIGFLINRYPLPERAESVIYLLFLIGWPPAFVIVMHSLIGADARYYDRRLITPALALFVVSLCWGRRMSLRRTRTLTEVIATAGNAGADCSHSGRKAAGETDITVYSLSHPPHFILPLRLQRIPAISETSA